MHMVHAEKMVTAIQRGTANTRWRDFGDIWSLSRQYPIAAEDLAQAVNEVAGYRRATIRPLAEILDEFADLAQAQWARWRRRSNSQHLPEQFAPVLQSVIVFADPVLTGVAAGLSWSPEAGAWQ